jgi:hypothetical protein
MSLELVHKAQQLRLDLADQIDPKLEEAGFKNLNELGRVLNQLQYRLEITHALMAGRLDSTQYAFIQSRLKELCDL